MNRYTTRFHSTCPNNGARVEYKLVVETEEMLSAEILVINCESAAAGERFHEEIAADLYKRLTVQELDEDVLKACKITLTAHHHGVDIETVLP